MTTYAFDPQLVADPVTFARAANANVTVYDALDNTNSTPLALTDLNGLPLSNPLHSTSDAIIPAFQTTSAQVKLVGGGITIPVGSFQSVLDQATAAKAFVQGIGVASTTTGTPGFPAAVTVDSNGQFRFTIPTGAAGPAGRDGSNVLPTDTAIANEVNDPASSTRGALEGTFTSKTKHARGLIPPNPNTVRLLPEPDVMVSPPTVTVGAANAGTTITGSIRHDGTDPAITFLSAGYTDPGSQGGYLNCKASSNLTTSQPAAGRMRFEFETDADVFEVAIITTSSGTNSQFRFWVNGEMVTAAPQTGLTAGGAIYFIKVDFGSRASRRILFEGAYLNFIGLWAHPTTTLWKTSRPLGPKAVWIGDSFSEGAGGNWWWDSWAMKAGRLLGWHIHPSAVGSTGYLANGGGGGKVKYRDRIANDVTALNPDIVIVAGGYNDTGAFTASQEGTEAALLYSAIQTGNPAATLVVCGPNFPTGITTTGIATQFRDAIQSAAQAAGAYWVDPVLYPNGESWITGSGNTSAPAGNGNADRYTGPDGVHPSQDGHDYIGRRFAASLDLIL